MAELLRNDGKDVLPRRADLLTALAEENAQLRAALGTQAVVEQAKGAVSVRLGTTPDVAFELMRGLARSQHRNLQEFAVEVVENAGLLEPDPHHPERPEQP